MEEQNKISLKSEVYRKSIHLFSIFVPIVYFYFLTKEQAVLYMFIATVGMILIDYMKRDLPAVGKLYYKYFGSALREDEKNFKKKVITGGTLFTIGMFLSITLFVKNVAVSAIVIMIVCDAASALIGKTIGKHKLIGNKTIEGSLAFLITGLLLIFFILPLSFNIQGEIYIGLVSLLIATIAEMMPWKIDDNILIPVTYGVIYTVLAGLFH